jgi:colicin import membrane protein
MKTNHKILLGLALGACLTAVTPFVSAAQQGKGQDKKEANQGNDDQDKDLKQKGKSDQAKDKGRGNNAKTHQNHGNQNRDKADNNNNNNNNRDKDKVAQDNEGNAYGKNKGDLSGREFGQQRAAQARLTSEQRRERLENSVEEGDKKVKDARTKIAKAREALEKDRSDKKLTDVQYAEKKARIERAERAVQVLEEKINEGRALGALQD